jgi:flagellar biosynthesis/type III secretory pathway M-ring protein FliF/YscJ
MEADPMQALQKSLESIVAQLKGLSPTARLLIGAMMVILVLSLLLVAMLAGRPNLVPLALPASLPDEAKARAVTYLQSASIPYEERSGRLHVPADRQYAILANLPESQVVGLDQIDFNTLMEQESPFLSRAQSEKRWLGMKMRMLSQMLSKMTGIRSAEIVIDEARGAPGFGRSFTPPSATVNIVTDGSRLTQDQVDAIARSVAKAHAGMSVNDVAVIDALAGVSLQARSADDLASAKYLELQREIERSLQAKIVEQLAIPGVRVAVNAIVDATREERHSTVYQAPVVGPLEATSRATNQSETTRAAESGVVPNTGVAIVPRGAPASTLSDERSSEKTQPQFPTIKSVLSDSKGYPLQINASISVPRSYLVRVHQEERSDPAATLDDAAAAAILQREKTRIEEQVRPLLRTAELAGSQPGQVSVEMHRDFGDLVAGSPMASESAGWAAAAGDSGLVKYVGLGSLALVCLAMMVMMVRRANVREELPTAAELVGVPKALETEDSDVVGEADESSPALEGVELDDAQLRRQQMLVEINEMVKGKPAEAATLVRKWMRSEE